MNNSLNLKSALLNELVVALDITIIVCYMTEYSFEKARKTKSYKENQFTRIRKGSWASLACEMLRFTFHWNNLVQYRANNWHW